MSKETAVDYLIGAIRKQMADGPVSALNIALLKRIAKDIEREQIRDSYIAGFNERDDVDSKLFFNPLAYTYCEKVFNQYYIETYK